MDKIYSRMRIPYNKNYYKVFKITFIFIVGIITAKLIINAINPIIDTQCKTTAKAIATKISNEQATSVMSKYKYDDLCSITRDTNGNITLINANVVAVNEIISDIAIKIQEQINNENNASFDIHLGSFTGSRLLSGRGPNIKIKMATTGNVDTDLRSEFKESGINQTIHRIYLQVDCNIIILTPFNNIQEKISNQVLLTEAVIVGITPDTYYNFNGLEGNDAMEVIN